MTANNLSKQSVGLGDLNNQMMIEAYTGFHNKFKSMDKKTSDWVRHNFQGTTIVAERDGLSLEFPVDDLRDGDTLVRIEKFPANLEKLVHVNDKLIKELENRGFNQFDVRVIKKQTGSAEENRKIA
ncbi:MAG: hypothetical protein MJE63_17075, partial [Proteobacteria bacterium]|nr:hypothetical protein [Pseudomonadota bacterium]